MLIMIQVTKMKREIRNLEEFKELIRRYETITLKEIKQANCSAQKLTGFGLCFTCTLCMKVNYKYSNENCKYCIYGPMKEGRCACLDGKNKDTYSEIACTDTTRTPKELLIAYRNRAIHLKKRYAKYLK